MSTVKIGINPITWTNDDVPALGGDTPLETCLRETREAGFAGTELGGKFPRESAALQRVLAAHQLELVSGWFDGKIGEKTAEDEFEAVKPHLQLLKDLGCKVVVYADTSFGRLGNIHEPISVRPHLPDDAWQAYGQKVTALADRMAAFGVRMAFHHHMGTIVETDAEVDLLMQHTGPSVGLLLDTGHSSFSGGNPNALVRRHAQRINHVHCKDYRPVQMVHARKTDQSFMQAVMDGIFTVPGDGCVDYADILGVLKAAGYSGWLVVEAEQDPAKAHPLTYATMGFKNLKALAVAAGFTVA